jgi:hypothetical protein
MGASESRGALLGPSLRTRTINDDITRMNSTWMQTNSELIAKVDAASSSFFSAYCKQEKSTFESYDALMQAYLVFLRQTIQPDDYKVVFYFRTSREIFEPAVRAAGGTVHVGRRTISGISLMAWP